MFGQIRSFIRDEFDRDARLMGSIAKDTFLTGDNDLDIFVFFPTDTSEETLEEEGLAIGEAVFDRFDGDYEVEYAEHPYTKGDIDGYEVEIVPAYNVESGAAIRSSVDRTPFHEAWVNEHLTDEEKDQVVLLKAFLRGQALYGSTLKVQGFSGYLCELLIAAYGDFRTVLDHAVAWDREEVLDPADHHDDGLPPELQEKFSEDSLVVIDPVDPDRNVAAVLTTENYARFVYSAWQYLQEPDTACFFPEDTVPDAAAIQDAAEQRGDFVSVQFPAPDMIDDLLYPQLRRLMRRLTQALEDNEFRIVESGFHVGDDQIWLLFELQTAELPDTRKHRGPPVFHNTDHIENFTEKYADAWVEGERLTTIVDREYPHAADLLRDVLGGDLQAHGVPEQLVPVVEDRVVDTGVPADTRGLRKFLSDVFKLR